MNYTDIAFIIINYYFIISQIIIVSLLSLLLIYFYMFYNYYMYKQTTKMFIIYLIQLIVTSILFMKPYGFVFMALISICKLILFKKQINEYCSNLDVYKGK